MRQPYIVRRRRTGIEAGYLKRITELEGLCQAQKKLIDEFVSFLTFNGMAKIENPKLLELIERAKRIK